ncbi:MAG: hypothetical protein IT243_07635 [Bacteroidia bacterium]|nr:hypothetical protein [Bacteroidia bacterium]
MKKKLQNLLFPNGIIYDREKGTVRTEKVNSVFYLIAQLARDWDIKVKGETAFQQFRPFGSP